MASAPLQAPQVLRGIAHPACVAEVTSEGSDPVAGIALWAGEKSTITGPDAESRSPEHRRDAAHDRNGCSSEKRGHMKKVTWMIAILMVLAGFTTYSAADPDPAQGKAISAMTVAELEKAADQARYVKDYQQ